MLQYVLKKRSYPNALLVTYSRQPKMASCSLDALPRSKPLFVKLGNISLFNLARKEKNDFDIMQK